MRKALAQGSCIDGTHWIAETPRLLEEAVRSGCPVQRVYAVASQIRALRTQYPALNQTDWVEVSARAMQAAAALESSQGVVALVQRPSAPTLAAGRESFFRPQSFLVILDRIQDPGNAGTIVRSAEAFGATGIVFLRGSASPDATKVLRASAGSLFRIPFLQGLSAQELLSCLEGFHVYAASPEAVASIDELPFCPPAALVIGNEGAGVCDEIDRRATGFRIPVDRVESLNAAVSAGIALYVMGRALRGNSGNLAPVGRKATS